MLPEKRREQLMNKTRIILTVIISVAATLAAQNSKPEDVLELKAQAQTLQQQVAALTQQMEALNRRIDQATANSALASYPFVVPSSRVGVHSA
jgi:chaperonin cofactor prefoldin